MSYHSYENFQGLVSDFEDLYVTKSGYDVIIHAGESRKALPAHINILCTRSLYFYAAYNNNIYKVENGKYIFEKPNIYPRLFDIILRYIYTGKIDLSTLQGPEVFRLLIAVNELGIQTLTPFVHDRFKTIHLDECLRWDPIEILETVCQHESFTNLWNDCLEKICEDPEIIFNSDKFLKLKEPILEVLLKHNDLNLDEIIIWNNLLKWCIAHTSIPRQNITNLRRKETSTLKTMLQRFIQLIKFHHISSYDFYDKIYPNKKLLPKDLVDKLLAFYLAPRIQSIEPSRKPKPAYGSVLIGSRQFALFASWIDKKEILYYDIRNIPYDFNLLYCASGDGATPEKFHEKCDKKGATIVISKIRDSNQVIGGYNPLAWDPSVVRSTTKDSFIFSFTCINNLESAKVSRSTGVSQCSVQYFSNCGPVFDDIDFQGVNHDNLYVPRSYHPRIKDMPTGNFNVEDFEVFQVINK